MRAEDLLPTGDEIREALANRAYIEAPSSTAPRLPVGDVLRAAAQDSAYRQFGGRLLGEGDRPIAVGVLALLFDSDAVADRTFHQVAQASHLRTAMGTYEVAVETVTGARGLVSYWAYLHRDAAIVVVTLDTLDPQQLSMSEFRSIVNQIGERLDAANTR